MRVSFELHWFMPGPVPEAVGIWFDRITKEWFQGAQNLDRDLAAPEKPREKTDLFLLARGRDDLTLRVKDGKLELFYRLKDGEQITSTHEKIAFTGILESWAKWRWRFSDEAQDQIDAAFQGSTKDRLSVTRTRREVKYEIGVSERLTPIPLGPTEAPAVSMELCQHRLADAVDWWSVDIDFSTPKVTPLMVEQLLRFYGGPKLGIPQSFGYPKWLSMMYKTLGMSSQGTTVLRRGMSQE